MVHKVIKNKNLTNLLQREMDDNIEEIRELEYEMERVFGENPEQKARIRELNKRNIQIEKELKKL